MKKAPPAFVALLLMLPWLSGCALCFQVIDAFLGGPSDPEHDRQNAIFQAYENDRKVLEEHPSGAWNPSTTP